MSPYAVLQPRLRWSMPQAWRQQRDCEWGRVNMRGRKLGCFLEGPCFERSGHLHVVDIPFGRIFRISEAGDWELRCAYDGWPNGLKVHRDGSLYIADYKRGLLRLEGDQREPETVAGSFRSEGFKGCNDLSFSESGDLYFTDQGQTGLHDPTGRVFRQDAQGKLTLLLDNVPSPNGLVMNSDETQLLVAVTRANAIWRLPLMDDGTVSKVGLFIQLSGGLAGPDGLALDAAGGLLVCHPGIGVWRFDPLGRPTHLVPAPEGSVWTNIAFGVGNEFELYIVDSVAGAIHCVDMPYAGKALPIRG